MDSEVELLRTLSAEFKVAGTKVALHFMSLLSVLKDDIEHGHFTCCQTNHEYFLDAVSWIDTRSRSRCFRPAPASRPPGASPSCWCWWERGLQPASASGWEKRPGIRCRGGVLKLKRRKRRAPLPTTSGCSAVHGEAKGALAWVAASELFYCGQPVMRRGRGFGGRTTRTTVSQNDCQQGLTAAFWP